MKPLQPLILGGWQQQTTPEYSQYMEAEEV